MAKFKFCKNCKKTYCYNFLYPGYSTPTICEDCISTLIENCFSTVMSRETSRESTPTDDCVTVKTETVDDCVTVNQKPLETILTVEGSTEDVLFGGENICELYSNEDDKHQLEEELNSEIGRYKYFYLKNQNVWIISLKNKELYKRYKNDNDFIGNRYKDLLKDQNKICLLTQIVNERVELKNIGKYLFYREVYLTTRKNKSILDLFKHYIGGDENRFYLNERDNIGYYRWKFIVHKKDGKFQKKR